MKFGDTLRQRSIPAWNAHNIDYDEIKLFIKDRTTPGKGKAISIAGRHDEKHVEFANALFHILDDQHRRIQLFVESKAGEIQRRLDHVDRQLKRLSAQRDAAAQGPISIRRLERYSKLEGDVLKAGDEIKSLARFTSTQRTAFRKLLKKYKKWTGSADLETRFRQEVLDSPTSFTKLDLDQLLGHYSDVLQEIRSLYETRMQQARVPAPAPPGSQDSGATPASQLLQAAESRSKVSFDAAVSSVSFGQSGSMAHYFVHPDNAVELQVQLLQYVECYASRSVPDTPTLPRSRADSHSSLAPIDYHALVADDVERLARVESTLTIDEREHLSGQSPQRAKVVVHWNDQEDALLTYTHRPASSQAQSVPLKRKYIETFFDAASSFSARPDSRDATTSLREDILKHKKIKPLYKIASSRARFVGLTNGRAGAILATMDTNIGMERASGSINGSDEMHFPFAILQVRTEGVLGNDLILLLNKSHLVERVRGFSIGYHALWQLYRPQRLAPPLWLPILNQDIRKLPPPAVRGNSSTVASSSGTQSGTQRSGSMADGTTAVETAGLSSSSPVPEIPPLRSFRKKRRRTLQVEAQQKYWSEYDHPNDLEDGGDDGYVIYIDPNEKSSLDRLLEKIGKFFASPKNSSTGHGGDGEPLLHTLDEAVSDSDEEGAVGFKSPPSYGAVTSHRPSSRHRDQPFLPHISIVCFFASLAILIVAYLLASTSKHKYVAEVDAGILFAIGTSLALAAGGWVPMFRRVNGSGSSVALAIVVLTIDVVGCGALLAWILA